MRLSLIPLRFFSLIGVCMQALLWVNVSGQSPPLVFEQLDEFPEIAYESIGVIMQDHTGFIWIGADGFFRYDGHTLKEYTEEEVPASLISTSVSFIFEDSHHRLWVGTRAGGLGRYLRSEDRFITYRKDPPDPKSLAHDYLNCMYEDTQGNLWIGTDGGLELLEIKGDSLTFSHHHHLPDNPNSLSHNEVTSIVEYPPQVLWIGTDRGGINRYDLRSREFVHYPHQKDHPSTPISHIVKDMLLDTFGHRPCLWIATFGSLDRLWLDEDSIPPNQFDHFQRKRGDSTSLPSNRLLALKRDSQGTIWVGTFRGGLASMQQEGDTISFFRYPASPDQVGSLGSDIIWEIFEDRQSMLWIGTTGRGIYRAELPQPLFDHYLLPPYPSGALPNQFITGFHEDKSHNLWLCTEGSGLFKYKEGQGVLHHYSANSGDIAHTIVTDIMEDDDGILWVATFGGLTRLNPKTHVSKHYKHIAGDSTSLSNNHIFAIYQDDHGYIWLGTRGGGLNRFDKKKESFFTYRNDNSRPNSLCNDYVWDICSDKRGGLWLTTDHGLCHLTFSTGEAVFESLSHDASDPNSLSSDFANVVHVAQDSSLWVSTSGGGVNHIVFDKGNNPKITRYHRQDGLPNETVYCILEDSQGRLWMSTDHGLSCLQPPSPDEPGSSPLFYNFDAGDGLNGLEFNMNSALEGSDGRFWFGGQHGFNSFHPDSIRFLGEAPDLAITGLSIINEPIRPGQKRPYGNVPLPRHINESPTLNLSHRDYVFTIHFASLSYIEPNRNRYAYMLEGFDETWNYVGNHNFATYTNLNSGHYTFRLKGSNHQGVWNEGGRTLEIYIAPPPWLSWWAFLIYALVIIGGIYAYIQYRIGVHRRELETLARIEQAKHDERELVRKKSSADFHDELGNKLTKISLFIELARRIAGDQGDLKKYLQKVEDNARSLSDGMRDFIWVLDPSKDSVYDALLRVKDFGENLFEMSGVTFQTKGINPSWQDLRLPLDNRRQAVLIFKEAMNNSLKYAQAKHAVFEAKTTEAGITITFSDDGVGFDIGQKSRGYGLENMRQRAQKMDAQFDIFSTPKKGTTIQLALQIPHLRDSNLLQKTTSL